MLHMFKGDDNQSERVSMQKTSRTCKVCDRLLSTEIK